MSSDANVKNVINCDRHALSTTLYSRLILLLAVILCMSACSRIAPASRPGTESDTVITNATAKDELDELDELDALDALGQGDANLDSALSPGAAASAPWQERSFKGNTLYTFSGEGLAATIRGHADGTASLLYRRQQIDATRTPWLNWRWKISNIYSNIDEKSRTGDDYPARLYVVVQTGLLPWDTRAVNYVWSSSNAIGESWENPFTEHAKMVVLQSGEQRVGQWVQERRNIVEDFKNLFNLDIAQLDGYAVMVDGDNSGNQGTGWFSHIQFSAQ